MAQVIMIASGKGGTGKSTVATFLAHELAFKGHKTFLTELDMGLRSIPMSIESMLSNGSHLKLYGISSGKTPSALRPPRKYSSSPPFLERYIKKIPIPRTTAK